MSTAYCPTCGGTNDESASFCEACGRSLKSVQAGGPPPEVPSRLVWAILVTLFCFFPPLGIVSIIYAVQVKRKLADGDETGAKGASEKAKMWAWISFGVGILPSFIFWALLLVAVGALIAVQLSEWAGPVY